MLGWSSSEEDNLSLATRSPLRKLIKHSTPEDTMKSHSTRPLGESSSLSDRGPAGASSMPIPCFEDLSSNLTALSSKATLRQKRLSTVSGPKEYSGQSEPTWGPLAPKEESPVSTTLAMKQNHVSPYARSWPRDIGWPGIPNTRAAGRNKRNLKKKAAVMQKVRQWEARSLQNIEEAAQYELTIQPE